MTDPNFSLIAKMLEFYYAEICVGRVPIAVDSDSVLQQIKLLRSEMIKEVSTKSDYEQARQALAEWFERRDKLRSDNCGHTIYDHEVMLLRLDTGDGPAIVTAGQLRALIAGPAPSEDAKDAARYRWLRNANNKPSQVIDKLVDELPSGAGVWEYRAGEELDAAIDAARLLTPNT